MPLSRKTPLRRTPLGRGSKPLRQISPKRQQKLDDEREWRDDYKRRHPRCEIGPILAAAGLAAARRCNGWTVDLHERKKRSRLGSTIDEHNVLGTCRACHDFTEDQVTVSTALGLLVPSWED